MEESKSDTDFVDSQKYNLVAAELTDDELVSALTKDIKSLDVKGTKVIQIIGGQGSGTTTLALLLVKHLGKAVYIGTDDYVVGYRHERRKNIEGGDPLKKYAIQDIRKHVAAICKLKVGEHVMVPVYRESDGLGVNPEEENYKKVAKVDYLIIEGDFEFLEDSQIHRKYYFDVPVDVRRQNRVRRDMEKRKGLNPNPEKIIENFNLREELQHNPYTKPAAKNADVIIKVDAEDMGNRQFRYTYNIYIRKI